MDEENDWKAGERMRKLEIKVNDKAKCKQGIEAGSGVIRDN